MAGTPTTNYNIPTYADTDAPDLSGAYNNAMGIIDTQLKANADAIESASTGNYTGNVPIVVNNEERTIGVAAAAVGTDGTGSASGVVAVTGKASAIGSGVALDSVVVPNARAVADYVAAHGGTAYTAGAGISISGTTISAPLSKGITASNVEDVKTDGLNTSFQGTVRAICEDASSVDALCDGSVNNSAHGWPGGSVPSIVTMKTYVAQKMAAAGAAYTGTAPVVVDNGSHTISVSQSTASGIGEDGSPLGGTAGTVMKLRAENSEGALRLDTGTGAYQHVTTAEFVKYYVQGHTPDASTSVKGLVQLTSDMDTANSTYAITGRSIANQRNSESCLPISVSALSNLVYNPASGMVFYKAPTE